jgi:hypothetical protein
MDRRSFLIFLAALPAAGWACAPGTACPICDGNLVIAGSLKDDVIVPSRNLELWNRSYHGDFWPLYSENSPVCSRCFAAFRQSDTTWARATELPGSFWVPLSEAIAGFPVPKKSSVSSLVVFSQEFKGACADEGVGESVAFWCRCSAQELAGIRSYTHDRGLSLSVDISRGDPSEAYITAVAPNKSFKPTSLRDSA